MSFNKSIVLLSAFVWVACVTKVEDKTPLNDEITKLKAEFAPDMRVAVLNVDAEQQGENYILKGETNLPNAIESLKKALEKNNISFIDSIQVLPTKALEGKTNAVITISVANLRSKPKHSSELATQATLGTPIKVLKKEGDWYYIQTPDNYLSWVDEGAITVMNDAVFNAWKATDKIIYTKTYGHSYNDDKESEIVSDLVAGNILEFVQQTDNHFIAAYPDGRIALLRADEAQQYSFWLTKNPTKDSLVATSKKLMGVPYLWGGTSTKGVDCSGFTKTIYFLNGMVIPRDASQQVYTGKAIDSVKNFKTLQKGDLLFFGRKATDSTKQKVVHVGMWIGNNEFIHSSGSGCVQIGSINANDANFDAFNLNRYVVTKRIFNEVDKAIIDLKKASVFSTKNK